MIIWPVDLRTSCDHERDWHLIGRSMADLLCHRGFFSCKDDD